MSLFMSKLVRGGFGLLAVAGATWLGAACNSSETIAGPNPLESESGFCQALAEAECSAPLVASCFNTDTRNTAAIDKDTPHCVAAASQADVCNPSGLPYHAEAAKDALDTITTIYADGVLTKAELPLLNAALTTVFNRGEAKGSKCAVDSDCAAADGMTCILHSGKGTCGSPMVVAAGQSCSLVSQACDADNFCDSAGSGGLFCRAKKAPSDKDNKCTGNFMCEAGSRCTNEVCRSLARDGADCSIGSDCFNGFCLKKDSDDKVGFCAGQDKFDPFSSSCDAYR